VFKKLLVFAIDFVLVGIWWWAMANIQHRWTFVERIAVICTVTVILFLVTKLVNAALTDSGFRFAQFVATTNVKKTALNAIVIVSMFELPELLRLPASVTELMLVVVAGVLILGRLRSRAME